MSPGPEGTGGNPTPGERVGKDPGPLVFVVGMMRSGTSAVTGAMVAMGLGADNGEDQGNYFNQKGFFESEALMSLSVAVLYLLGGFWYAPPELPPDLWSSVLGRELTEAVRGPLATRLPATPAVWKDPQATLTLPVWRAAIERPLGAVLVWRDPVEVALSMWRGVRCDIPLGMAVWAEHNLRALAWTEGLPLYVCRYERILEDPAAFPEAINRLLSLLGEPQFADAEHCRQAAGFFEKGLQHQTPLPPYHPYLDLARELDPLVETLNSLEGLHPGFVPPGLPPLPGWATEVLGTMRRTVMDARRAKNVGRAGARTATSEVKDHVDSSAEGLHTVENFTSMWPVFARRTNLIGSQDGSPAPGSAGSPGVDGIGLTVSVVVPVWRPSRKHLQRFLGSVVGQTWSSTEVCLCDDGSADDSTSVNLGMAALFDRVRVSTHQGPASVAAAARTAYELSTGDFVAFGEAQDVLRVDAVERVADALRRYPDADVLYSDECKADVLGVVFTPDLKPRWSPNLLLAEPYLGRLLVVRKSLLDQVGGIGDRFPDDAGYDIMLRATERARQVVHIPDFLYYWTWASIPVLHEPARLPWSHEPARRSLEEALGRRGGGARIEPGPIPCTFHLRWPVPDDASVTTVVLVHRHASGSVAGVATALRRCVHAVTRTGGERVTGVVIAMGDDLGPEVERVAANLQSDPRVRVVTAPGAEDGWSPAYSAANRALTGVDSPYACFLHADSVPEPGWIDTLLEQACRPEIGAVGARLVTAAGDIQHSGIGLTATGARWFAGALDGALPSALRWAGLIHECSAVSSACLMTPIDALRRVGGFQPGMGAFSDVDYCRRLDQLELRTVFTPLVEVVHSGAVSEGLDGDAPGAEAYRRHWPAPGADPVGQHSRWQPDPYISPALNPNDPRLETLRSPAQMGFRLEEGEWVWEANSVEVA